MHKTYSLSFSFLLCVFVYIIALAAAFVWVYFFQEKLHSLLLVLMADILATLVVFFFSVVFKNASLYDAYWSVAPPLIAWYWFDHTGWGIVSVVTLAVISLWAIRLTYNWARAWQGLGHEDWRYKMLHDKNPSLYWFTNLAGIHLFPTLMVFAGMLPVYFISTQSPDPIHFPILIIGAIVCVAATAIELLADEQMRKFKKHAQPTDFIQTGVWKYSRHPNYFGEISFWFGLWVIQLSVAPQAWYGSVGFVAMLIMFLFASIPMMEEKNKKNKPGYATYIQQVSVLVPWPRK